MIKNNHNKFIELRNTYKYFVYESFSKEKDDSVMKVIFHFNLNDECHFYPTLTFSGDNYHWDSLTPENIDNFLFHIGLIELISYWKAACSPEIIIKPFNLNEEQVQWWKKTYYHGLGEFFYLNGIDTNIDDFVDIRCDSNKKLEKVKVEAEHRKVLVPIGGGKDSVVTLELLKKNFNVMPFIINPRKASMNTINAAGFGKGQFLQVDRTIHAQLLELNEKGFLNGHTPFSAMLAFVSLFSAALSESRYIALSNESSANEPTDPKTGVNHQYSKSLEFESDFRNYVAQYLSDDIKYFSFLRPLSELQISMLFSKLDNHFNSFRSCNVGSKTDSWCCSCSKCLFTYIILSPFIGMDQLKKIFEEDLFENESLKDYFDELVGVSPVKPFECVGTVSEVNLSLKTIISNYNGNLPFLLKYYTTLPVFKDAKHPFKNMNLNLLEEDHFLPVEYLQILKANLNA